MKAVIIDAFNNYEVRTKYVYQYLKNIGFDTIILTSNFNHSLKIKEKIDRDNTITIDTKPYFKNISLRRISSHLDFSKKVFNRLCEIKPDLIYCLLPVNSLAKKVNRFKRKYRETKIYFDIFDLWPESMPVGSAIKKLLFPWRNLRDNHLSCANNIFLECSYYEKFLPNFFSYSVAYLCKEKREVEYQFDENELKFLYLGSINHIIDIEAIVTFLKRVQEKRNVRLIIIGGGESQDAFITALSYAKIPFTNHGKIFDEQEKDRIISECQFGINMYRSGLCIGLTMKSLDYFCRGLPIVSQNIFDTLKIIDEFSCGLEVSTDAVIDAVVNINSDEWKKMHENTLRAYQKYFSPEIYQKNLNEGIGV